MNFKGWWFVLAGWLAVQPFMVLAAGEGDHPAAGGAPATNATYAMLSLDINGSGVVGPFQNGDSLAVGRRYVLNASPLAGYRFAGWKMTTVFIEITWFTNEDGTAANHISTTVEPRPGYVSQSPILKFTMPAGVVVVDKPLITIIATTGWQANFVAFTQHHAGKVDGSSRTVAAAISPQPQRRRTRRAGGGECAL